MFTVVIVADEFGVRVEQLLQPHLSVDSTDSQEAPSDNNNFDDDSRSEALGVKVSKR